MKKTKVIVLMGGRSPEYDVSLATGRGVLNSLDPKKFVALPVVISRDGRKWELYSPQKFLTQLSGEIKESPSELGEKKVVPREVGVPKNVVAQMPDVVFIAMHGPYGEDGTIQGLLELSGLRYTGSGVLASALGMDKTMFRKIMEREKISVPEYLVFSRRDSPDKIWKRFKNPPVFIKPFNQGSSIGCSIVHQKGQLKQCLELAFSYSDPILVEEFLKGIEVSCGVLGNDKPVALPVVEIIPEREFFNYEAKYLGTTKEIVPARLPKNLTEEVQRIALLVFSAIGARGFARIDMIIHKNKPIVLEINTIPGLTPASLLPKEAASAGISYPKLIEHIINFASKK